MSREYTNKAKRSFFGARPGGQDRPQDINTPQWMIDVILELWPEGIFCDPCANNASLIDAKIEWFGPDEGGSDGLSFPWPNYTYANPPYNKLKDWLVKPIPRMEHLMLCPCRPNRAWYCDAMDKATRICWLKPFAFEGHTQAYPSPLGLGYWGTRIMEFTEIFSRYGKIGRFVIYE